MVVREEGGHRRDERLGYSEGRMGTGGRQTMLGWERDPEGTVDGDKRWT